MANSMLDEGGVWSMSTWVGKGERQWGWGGEVSFMGFNICSVLVGISFLTLKINLTQ